MTAHPPVKTAFAVLRRRPVAVLSLLLMVGTLIVFWPVRHNEFIDYDDHLYVSENPHLRDGLTWAGVRWASTADLTADSPNADYWIPATFLSHLIVIQLFGMDPAAHHLANVLLHALNAMLLFVLLQRMTGSTWPSAFVAALFAVHPLHVESVAWVSERKDVLSGLFFMLTLWAYVRYVERPALHRYLAVVLVFALGLMAKPMLVTVPCLLLLLDYWPLHRIPATAVQGRGRVWWRLAREKVPLFALAAASAVITLLAAQREGVVHSFGETPASVRLGNVLVSYVSYIGRMIWPHDLAVLYPYPRGGVPAWQAAGAGVLLVCISLVAIRERRRRPYLIAGWLWYLVALVPVIGLVQAGVQAMADRYTYLPLIGLFILAAWGLSGLLASLRYRQVLLSGAAIGTLAFCIVMVQGDLRYWRNDATLFEQALRVTEGNYIAYNNVGIDLVNAGRLDDARNHFQRAIEINPDFALAHNNLGTVLAAQGRHDEAIRHFAEALRLAPGLVEAKRNLGNELAQRGDTDAAIDLLTDAIRLDPDFAQTHSDLGSVLLKLGRRDDAIAQLAEAMRLNPNLALAHNTLGMALGNRGRFEEAIAQFTEAVRLDPGLAPAHNNLGIAYDKLGRSGEAVQEFEIALRLDPSFSEARMNLNRVFQTQHKAGKAAP
ncbi:MAG: tetratricopeptide repeat protein [Nitrospirae bacterium]|nr:tetratricopeptide repeat protein [Nitrospirota bacterium]